ncbi:KAP family P-loop NTPase fold protein [Sinorhizobium fredii]|uniref:KAP family P-loop NTPase fold protein n=1 Tax=Rhizobium fredii TaxID=380 RepID=UPI003511D2CF
MTEESLDTIWHDDLLDRKGDAEFLEDFLVNRMQERNAIGRTGSYVLNIDAAWGFGKSFFMQRFKQQLELSNHPVVMIDAWKNDFSDDPYTNVIAEIEAYFQSFIEREKEKTPKFVQAYQAVKANAAKISWLALKGVTKRASRYVIAEGTDEIIEVIDQHVVSTGKEGEAIGDAMETHIVEVTDGIIDSFAKKRLEQFNAAKVSLDNFRESLSKLLTIFEEHTGKKLPFFIFIDELDRCRPTYAIAMLERIKHLFDADNVVFVLSTDTDQLAHSINAVYGTSFDSRRYLQRFFMRTYELPAPNTHQLIESLMASYQPDTGKWANPGVNQDAHEYLSNATLFFKMSLRETEQAFDILASLTTIWKEKFPIQLGIMYPMILGHLRRQDITDFSSDGWLIELIKKTRQWVTTDHYRNRNYGESREQNSVSDWISHFLGVVNQPLNAAMREGYNWRERDVNFHVHQAYDIVEREYHARFGGNVNEEAKSMVLSYPDLIRHAGRLSI